MYINTLSNQQEIGLLTIPDYPNQGTWEWTGGSFIMHTNPDLSPWYFYLFANSSCPIQPAYLRVIVSLDVNIKTFGIGWQVIQNGQLAIMFSRLNFNTNTVQILRTTAPHTWEDVNVLPFDPRGGGDIRMRLDIDPANRRYQRLAVRWGEQLETYALSTIAEPTPSPQPDGLIIKINPQASEGVSGTASLDEILMDLI